MIVSSKEGFPILTIPEEYLRVCRHGHVTAPGWGVGPPPRDNPAPGATPRWAQRCARTTLTGLCDQPNVLVDRHPVLASIHRLGGEPALAEALEAGLDAEIPWR